MGDSHRKVSRSLHILTIWMLWSRYHLEVSNRWFVLVIQNINLHISAECSYSMALLQGA